MIRGSYHFMTFFLSKTTFNNEKPFFNVLLDISFIKIKI